MPMTEKQIEAVLDRACIGHTRGSTLRKGDWWVTAGSVHIVPVAHAFEREVRAQAEATMRRALQALDGPSHSWEESKAEAERILGAWLAEKQQEVAHG